MKTFTSRALFLATLLLTASSSGAATRVDLDALQLAEDLRNPDDAALIQAAQSFKPELRARAALAWGRIQKPAGLAPLYVLGLDFEPSVRREVAFALGQFGWKPEFSAGRESQILDQLIPMLLDSDTRVKLLAIEAIGKVGLARVPETVKGLLTHPEGNVRAAALLALYRYRLVNRLRTGSEPEALPQAVVDAMLPMADDYAPIVRRNLAYFFARSKDARGLDAVISLASDADQEVRFFAVSALIKIADPRGLAAAIAATGDADYTIRVAAVNALAAIGKTTEIPVALYQDSSFHVRAAIAAAIGASQDAPVELLLPFTQDASPTVASAAFTSLQQRLGDDSILLLVDGLVSKSWPVRAAVLTAYGEIAPRNSQALPMLVTGAYDKDPRVVSAAITALAGVEGDQAWYLIKRALLSDAPAIVGAAVDALAARKEAERGDRAWDTYSRLSGPRWNDQRVALIGVVAGVDGDASTRRLLEALLDPAHAVAVRAVQALHERGIDVPVPAETAPTVSPYRDASFARNPHVILETTKGEIEIEAFAKEAPIHVANFVGLAKAGKYDGTAFHRVVSNFVIQGGSFDGSGWDGGDYAVRAEINRAPFLRGALGMPRNDDFDSGSVQLFLNHIPTPHLDGQYTVFGQTIRGVETIDQIEIGDEIIRARVIE